MSNFIDSVFGPNSNLSTDQKKVVAAEVQTLAALKPMPQDALVKQRETQVLSDLMQAAQQATQDDPAMSDSDQAAALALNLFADMNPQANTNSGGSLFSSHGGFDPLQLGMANGLGYGNGSNYGSTNSLGGNSESLRDNPWSKTYLGATQPQYGYNAQPNQNYTPIAIRRAINDANARAFSGGAGNTLYSSGYSGAYNSNSRMPDLFGRKSFNPANPQISQTVDSGELRLYGNMQFGGTLNGKDIKQTAMLSSHDDLFDASASIPGGYKVGNVVGNTGNDNTTKNQQVNVTAMGHNVSITHKDTNKDPEVMVDGKKLNRNDVVGPVNFGSDGKIRIEGTNDKTGAKVTTTVNNTPDGTGLDLKINNIQGVRASGALVAESVNQKRSKSTDSGSFS